MDDLERLYKTHYPAVVRFLYRKIWDPDRAEDRAAIRRKKHLTLLKDDPIPLSTPEPSAEEAVEREERWARVSGALAELSERDRDVLLLWDAGLSYPEIAAQTGLAVGAVGTTLARARKRLIEAHDRMDY